MANDGDNREFDRAELASVKSDIHHLGSQIATLTTNMTELTNTVSRIGKTDWATLATWAGVIVTALVYHGELRTKPLVDNLERHQQLLERAFDQIDDHTGLDSHGGAEIRFEEYQKQIDNRLEHLRELIELKKENQNDGS